MNGPVRAPEAVTAADLARFAAVRTWVFDLDNTLYPSTSPVFSQVGVRIRAFVRDLLGTSEEEAERIQADFHDRYGATLRGLIVEHDIDADAFLEYVHDIDHSALVPDPALAAAIERLPGRRFILTNGSRRHAETVAARLGFTDHFEDIFDIVSAGHLPKPSPETYDRFLKATGADPTRTAMFEDLPRNLLVPHRLGMATVLVVPPGTPGLVEESLREEDRAGEHVDFLTDDLAGFLAEVAGV